MLPEPSLNRRFGFSLVSDDACVGLVLDDTLRFASMPLPAPDCRLALAL